VFISYFALKAELQVPVLKFELAQLCHVKLW